MKILVTGCAGFIGFHVAKLLLARGDKVVGVDNLNDYYDPSLKHDRLAILRESENFSFTRADVADKEEMKTLFAKQGVDRFEGVVHLAAQAGVRHSLKDPHAYVETNVVGFLNVLEQCRARPVKHLVYASTSSVYGEDGNTDHPISLYAATKKANEDMAYAYSHLFRIPTTGLRFFTVYGPWGRPDMALFKFVKAILEDKPIELFNGGGMNRDFTYVDDIAAGIVRALDNPPLSVSNHAVYDLGGGRPVRLIDFVAQIEFWLGKKAKRELLPMQAGDVVGSKANTAPFARAFGMAPPIPVEIGVRRFIEWYREYYKEG